MLLDLFLFGKCQSVSDVSRAYLNPVIYWGNISSKKGPLTMFCSPDDTIQREEI